MMGEWTWVDGWWVYRWESGQTGGWMGGGWMNGGQLNRWVDSNTWMDERVVDEMGGMGGLVGGMDRWMI